ncbi:MAG TPA: glycerol dehydrogenase [Candidatus Olsenella avicola]|uniref:glycerol dehydrogenase n=1 Tax=Olsenella sp. An285 TaxID=1965621 RepID=UPI000B3882C9|nr:glycerol dehydrogenase [Olsenella sp. An285]OUO48475.1 glycerol dehydrogenase [Olsenella sp. An285]HIY50729.1 glycerol dehydrogenase [Candidatus Olsenella avicola]
MARVFISPSKYVQGPGELAHLGSYVKAYGAHALVVISAGGLRRSGDVISASFAEAGVELTYDNFNGECSQAEIDRLVEVYRSAGTDVVVGVGGGKIFDTAKAVAAAVDAPVVIVPTIAATDAPCSALSVIYTDEGQFKEYQFFKQNPNLVLMDTDVISASPVRLTVSGMGDALATYFEARACKRSDATTCAGGHVTEAAMALAQLCYETLISDGLKAKLALEAGACTESVEKIIEANTLLSGLGFESAGLAGAHAIHNGMTAMPETHAYYHGEKVAFGTLTQLVLENADELYEVLDFCVEVGLPVTFAQLGVEDASYERVLEVAKLACAENDTLGNMPFEVTPEKVAAAMLAADAYGRAALAE